MILVCIGLMASRRRRRDRAQTPMEITQIPIPPPGHGYAPPVPITAGPRPVTTVMGSAVPQPLTSPYAYAYNAPATQPASARYSPAVPPSSPVALRYQIPSEMRPQSMSYVQSIQAQGAQSYMKTSPRSRPQPVAFSLY
eukprot:NODE_2638_length_762_cov_230.514727_g1848_i0.p3 GENE.NODE_2638_length_762_cov_230.514727_g1848_i0~~NODE_2638_length_762_cov_230.514727_g1848_i0.p3  ORF type:complete len:139 (+),score=21.38 NODE_2638_length_762_cov_230.514727_g1848_i0:203-619(+)